MQKKNHFLATMYLPLIEQIHWTSIGTRDTAELERMLSKWSWVLPIAT